MRDFKRETWLWLVWGKHAADQLGDVIGNFALGKVTNVGEFDALIAFGKPFFLAPRGGREIDGIGQAAPEQERNLDLRKRLLVQL